MNKDKRLSVLRQYAVSLAIVTFSIIISDQLPALSQVSSLFIILAAIVFNVWHAGLGPGLLSIFVAIMGIAYNIMPPLNSLAIASNDNILRLILFILTSLLLVLFASSRQVAQTRLARSNEERGRLTARMDTIREEERARLAREIHDQVGGSLSILKLDVASLHKRLKHDKTLQDKANDILKEIDGAFLTVQQIAMELRPSLLDHFSLAAAIESHLDTHCPQFELDCEKDIDPKINLQGACAIAIFRVFQEAFLNVIRHAKATKITVQLKQDKTGIRLSVTDNGVGIERGQTLKPDALGLIGMRERMRPFEGTVTLSGRHGVGTTVTTVVPIRSASPILIAKSATTLLPEQHNPS